MYIEKVLDLWVQLMKNGGKNKSVAFIILVSIVIACLLLAYWLFIIKHILMPYSVWPYSRALDPIPYLNLTNTLLTINKQQSSWKILNSEYVFANIKCSNRQHGQHSLHRQHCGYNVTHSIWIPLSVELLLEINITFAIMLIFHEFALTSDWANKHFWHAVREEGSELRI